jgi:ankyrin repeat protein
MKYTILGLICLLISLETFATDQLIVSAAEGDLDSVKRLIEAEHNDVNYQAKNVLVYWDKDRSQRFLDIGSTALIAAARTKKKEIVEYLIDHQAGLDHHDVVGRTPLVSSLLSGGDETFEIVDLLLDKGAKLNLCIPNTYIGTPLILASGYFGDSDLLEHLIERGADVDFVCGQNSPLLEAVIAQRGEAVKTLLKHGANTEARDKFQATSLIVASQGVAPNVDIVNDLIAAGANVNAQDDKGWTALMKGAYSSLGSSTLVVMKKLLDAGASKKIKNQKRNTATEIAGKIARSIRGYSRGERELARTKVDLLNEYR